MEFAVEAQKLLEVSLEGWPGSPLARRGCAYMSIRADSNAAFECSTSSPPAPLLDALLGARGERGRRPSPEFQIPIPAPAFESSVAPAKAGGQRLCAFCKREGTGLTHCFRSSPFGPSAKEGLNKYCREQARSHHCLILWERACSRLMSSVVQSLPKPKFFPASCLRSLPWQERRQKRALLLPFPNPESRIPC
jgi:hypothetical protein